MKKEMRHEFGDEITNLVLGVTKLGVRLNTLVSNVTLKIYVNFLYLLLKICA